MKKCTFLVLSMIASLLLINVVKAEGPYYLDFETNLIEGEPREELEYKDGYLFIDDNYSSDGMVLSYYSNKGKLNKSLTIRSYYRIAVWDDDIYLIGEIGNAELTLYKLDSDLSIKKQVSFDDISFQPDIPDSDLPGYLEENRYLLHYDLFVDNGYINFIDYNGYIHPFTKDLEPKEQHQATEKEFNNIYKNNAAYKLLSNKLSQFDNVINIDSNSNNIVVATNSIKESCDVYNMNSLSQSEKENCFYSRIILFDKDGKEIWQKEMPKKTLTSDVHFAHGYIVTIVKNYSAGDNNFEFDNTKDTIVIYDMKGNEIQTITTKYGFDYLVATKTGFMVTQDTCSEESVFGVFFTGIAFGSTNQQGLNDPTKEKHGPINPPTTASCRVNHQVYYLVLKIDTKVVSGKGSIKAVNSARPGEPITFVVTPEEGYELGVVKVTDALGNVVYFNSYTFTMPNANVLIEATFVPKNPKTADIAIAAVAITMVITTILVVYQYIVLTKPKEIK